VAAKRAMSWVQNLSESANKGDIRGIEDYSQKLTDEITRILQRSKATNSDAEIIAAKELEQLCLQMKQTSDAFAANPKVTMLNVSRMTNDAGTTQRTSRTV
jgi:hypothetical protein